MSQFATCRIVFANDPPAGYTGGPGDNWIEIRQVADPEFDCDLDKALVVEIEVMISRDDLNYDLQASYGELSGKSAVTKTKNDPVEISGESSYQLKYRVDGKVSAEWDGEVVGMNGVIPGKVPITQNGQVLDFGQRVWGTLQISYDHTPDIYTLVIRPRPEGSYDDNDLEGAYRSTIRAIWDGDPEIFEVKLPSDMTNNCDPRTTVKINPDDPEALNCKERRLLVDPCDLTKPPKETITPIVCPGV